MLQVELLSLKKVSTASLLAWLTRPTGPHLVEATSDGELRTALAILWTPEALHDPKTSKVGVGLVYKAPYIRSASFSEAYFSLKSASGTEVGKRSSDTSLMFIHITEASQVIPHPTEWLLFLDIKHPSLITDSNAPRPPQVFRGFKLHKVHLVKEDTNTTQVAIPRLEGENTHHMITYQKLVLLLTQLDAAHEDMERFLHYRLSQLHAQTELRSLLRNLTERMAAHQCRVHQIVQSEALKNIEVSQQVLVGLGADQPIESNFFPGVLEGLLGSLGINAAGGKTPPTSSREGVAQMWASAVLGAV